MSRAFPNYFSVGAVPAASVRLGRRIFLTRAGISDIHYIHAETLDCPGSERTRPSAAQLAACDCPRKDQVAPARECGASQGETLVAEGRGARPQGAEETEGVKAGRAGA